MISKKLQAAAEKHKLSDNGIKIAAFLKIKPDDVNNPSHDLKNDGIYYMSYETKYYESFVRHGEFHEKHSSFMNGEFSPNIKAAISAIEEKIHYYLFTDEFERLGDLYLIRVSDMEKVPFTLKISL